jgi:hypothetical protein
VPGDELELQHTVERIRIMNTKLVILSVLAAAGAVCGSHSVRAQTLDVTLVDPNAVVAFGTTDVAFAATISNPATDATLPAVYLNFASATTVSPGLTVDLSPFFSNAPLFLASGQNSGAAPFELFNVNLAPGLAAGTYSGNDVSIQGGADGGALTAVGELADSLFSITVSSATVLAPEIDPASSAAALTLLAGCLLVLRGRRAVTLSCQ